MSDDESIEVCNLYCFLFPVLGAKSRDFEGSVRESGELVCYPAIKVEKYVFVSADMLVMRVFVRGYNVQCRRVGIDD